MALHYLTDYYSDVQLLAELRELLAASYEVLGPFALKGLAAPVPGIEAGLYTLRDEAGRLVAFCTVGYHQLGGRWHGYAGLTTVRERDAGATALGCGGRCMPTAAVRSS